MKLLLSKILIFITSSLCILYVISLTFDSEFSDYSELEKIVSEHREINILLGDSHFIPLSDHLKDLNYLNISYASDSINDLFVKYKYLVEKGIIVNSIILLADYHMFSNYRMKLNNHEKSYLYAHLIDYIKLYDGNIEQYLFNRFISLCNLHILNKGGIEYFNKLILQKYIKQSVGVDVISTINTNTDILSRFNNIFSDLNDENRKINTKKRFNKQFQESINERLILNYEDFVDQIKLNGSSLILLRMPVSNEYIELLNQYSALEKLQNNKIFKENLLLDYSDLFKERQDYFDNADHLNIEGGKIMSQILQDTLKLINHSHK